MKRVAGWLVVAALVGLVGLGQPPAQLWEPWMGIPQDAGTGPIEVPSSFQIPPSFVMWVDVANNYDDLDFSGIQLTNVTAPGFIGEAYTNTLAVYGVTNAAITITGEAWGFKGKGTCARLLPTRLHGYAHRWSPGWIPFLGGVYDVGPYRTFTYNLPNCAGGYYFGWLVLYVTRNGYDDPADTYEAKIKITVSGI